MRRCSRCGLEKAESEYSSVTSGYCKPCSRIYRRERYVPVGEDSRSRRQTDIVWRRRHDRKVCQVCKRNGSDEVVFRKLSNKRCSDCMTKGLWHCPTHGTIRKARCQKCRYVVVKRRRAEKKIEAFEKQVKDILLVTGDGHCGRCGKIIRTAGKLDRSHRCE